MEKIKLLNQKVKGNLIFCFKDSKLHIGVDNNRDSYELNFFKTINATEAEKDIMNELNDIISFIDDLQLDKTLFGKEV